MNKNELVTAMAGKSKLSKKDTEKALRAFEESVTEELGQGGKVQLVGFGTFDVTTRSQREGRNPQTGEHMVIPAARAVRFKAGKALKDTVNAPRG
jgi:DNA-binding protein HU-beta